MFILWTDKWMKLFIIGVFNSQGVAIPYSVRVKIRVVTFFPENMCLKLLYVLIITKVLAMP